MKNSRKNISEEQKELKEGFRKELIRKLRNAKKENIKALNGLL